MITNANGPSQRATRRRRRVERARDLGVGRHFVCHRSLILVGPAPRPRYHVRAWTVRAAAHPAVTTPACPRCGVIVAKARPMAARDERIERWRAAAAAAPKAATRPPAESAPEESPGVSRWWYAVAAIAVVLAFAVGRKSSREPDAGGVARGDAASRWRTSPTPHRRRPPLSIYPPPPSAAEIKAEVQGLSDADRLQTEALVRHVNRGGDDDRVRCRGGGGPPRRAIRRKRSSGTCCRPSCSSAADNERRRRNFTAAAAVPPARRRPRPHERPAADRAGGHPDRGRGLDGRGGRGAGGAGPRPPPDASIWQQLGLRAPAAGPEPGGGGGAPRRPRDQRQHADPRAAGAGGEGARRTRGA